MPSRREQHPGEPQSKKTGALLVDEGYVHASDIDTALKIQQQEAGYAALPLGKYLVKKGLISAAQLQKLLAHPELRVGVGDYAVEAGLIDRAALDGLVQTKKPGIPADFSLDKILLRRGILSEAHLRSFLERQLDSMDLGALAVRLNMIRDADLAYALRAKKSARTIGEILCDLNLITPIELNALLTRYRKQLTVEQILIKQGAIDEPALARVVAARKDKNDPIGKILVQAGVITETQLYEALAVQYNLPFRQFDRLIFSPEQRVALTDIIGPDFARRFHVLPVGMEKTHLTVAISDPESISAIRALRTKQVDLRIDCALITGKTFERLFRLIYRSPLPVTQPDTDSAAPMTKPKTYLEGTVVGVEVISDPTAQPQAIARLHSVYETLVTASGQREKPSELHLFSSFIQYHFQQLCRNYRCAQILFKITATKSGAAITAEPAALEAPPVTRPLS